MRAKWWIFAASAADTHTTIPKPMIVERKKEIIFRIQSKIRDELFVKCFMKIIHEKHPLGETSDILLIIEIYAREILPLSIFRKRSLGGDDRLFCLEICDDSFCMSFIELRKYIIKEEYDREIEMIPQEGDLEIFESEEERFIFPTGEIKTRLMFSILIRDQESKIIEMWSYVCMSREDIPFPMLFQI